MNTLRFYRLSALVLAAVFAAVGAAFVLLPGGTLGLFNAMSRSLGIGESPAAPGPFFPILAGAYMVLVTALAWTMARRPTEPVFPLLLCQAKGASAALSFASFFLGAPFLIHLANGIVDGTLCLGALALYRVSRTLRAAGRPLP